MGANDLVFRTIEDKATYDQKLYDFMKAREGVKLKVYTDTEGVATIGIGYAFNKDTADIRADFAAVGITVTDNDINIINYINENPSIFKNLTASQLDAKLRADPYAGYSTFSFSLGNENQAKNLFEVVRPIYEERMESKFKSILGNQKGQELYDSLQQTEESIAVFSIIYNTGTIGSNLTNDFYNGDRVGAYYEIRYNYNRDQTQWAANRRYSRRSNSDSSMTRITITARLNLQFQDTKPSNYFYCGIPTPNGKR